MGITDVFLPEWKKKQMAAKAAWKLSRAGYRPKIKNHPDGYKLAIYSDGSVYAFGLIPRRINGKTYMVSSGYRRIGKDVSKKKKSS